MARQVEAWEAGSENTLGLVVDTDGTSLVLTRVESRSFKSRAAAVKWLCPECANEAEVRTDSERYAELRQLVECWQKNLGQAHKDALIQWKHR